MCRSDGIAKQKIVNTLASDVLREKTSPRRRDQVWEHFTETPQRTHCQCNYCPKRFPTNTCSIGGMINHMRKHHMEQFYMPGNVDRKHDEPLIFSNTSETSTSIIDKRENDRKSKNIPILGL